MKIALIITVLIASVACRSDQTSGSEREIEDVTPFFTSGARFGMSPDAGLYKKSDPRGQWDHVATIHGMADDMDLCQTIVTALAARNAVDTYSCRLMN